MFIFYCLKNPQELNTPGMRELYKIAKEKTHGSWSGNKTLITTEAGKMFEVDLEGYWDEKQINIKEI